MLTGTERSLAGHTHFYQLCAQLLLQTLLNTPLAFKHESVTIMKTSPFPSPSLPTRFPVPTLPHDESMRAKEHFAHLGLTTKWRSWTGKHFNLSALTQERCSKPYQRIRMEHADHATGSTEQWRGKIKLPYEFMH